MTALFLYRKPARGRQPFNSMDVLSVLPEHVLDLWPNPTGLVDAAVNALNCCRKYSKGVLTWALDGDLNEVIAIQYRGEVRTFRALSALTLWMPFDDAFEFLRDVAGMPLSVRADQARSAF